MVASCPQCKARYRVDETRIGEDGVRLKCAKCEAVFRVRAPAAAATPPAASAPVASADPAASPDMSAMEHRESSPAASASPAQAAPPTSQAAVAQTAPVSSSAGEGEVVDRERLVLIADSDVESGKATANKVSSWGLQPILVHDGVEAMLTIQRMLPRAVVLDAALPKMFGFQVCEVLKRNESLRNTGVVLIGAIHNRDRYRRPPADLYGADHYLEQPDLPDGLGPILIQLGMNPSLGEGHATPAPPPEPMPAPETVLRPEAAPGPAPVAAPIAPASTPSLPPAPQSMEIDMPSEPASTPVESVAPDGQAEERAKAERLARIVVSDIILYQPDKFSEAVRQGNVVEAMDSEIGEGRVLFRQRIDEQVREERDFIVDELVRVARERGMK